MNNNIINEIGKATDYSGSMPDLNMNKVLNSLRKVWKTNPSVSFVTLLGLIEEDANKAIIQLTDGEIINATANMDISNYLSNDDIKEILNNLKIETVYDNSNVFAGYVILSSDDKSLKDGDKFQAKYIYEPPDQYGDSGDSWWELTKMTKTQ
jgi:hypothetical protein